jgi:hypothetical protein
MSIDFGPLIGQLRELRRIDDAHRQGLLPTIEELDRCEEAIGRLILQHHELRFQVRPPRHCLGSHRPMEFHGAWQVPRCSVCPRVLSPTRRGAAPEHAPPESFAIAEPWTKALFGEGC